MTQENKTPPADEMEEMRGKIKGLNRSVSILTVTVFIQILMIIRINARIDLIFRFIEAIAGHFV